MRTIIPPGTVNGLVIAPSSKSMTQRAYALALLQSGSTIIHNAGNSEDEKNALSIIKQLGARIIDIKPGLLQVESNGVAPLSGVVNCGESGLAARLFTPIAALSRVPVSITGSGTLLKRPMYGFNQALTVLGISVTNFSGYLPITVHGPIESHSFQLNAANGSQFLSGLLFALAYSATDLVTIEVADLKSKPYIDMTLDMLAMAGKPIAHDNYTSFYINPSRFSTRTNLEINVEGDWSGAANFLVAGAIAGSVTIKGLDRESRQADAVIIKALSDAGAKIEFQDSLISVHKAPLQGIEFDATHCPDLFPILAILAACSEGESYLSGIHRLHDKESNRVESIVQMLECFEVDHSIEDDAFCIKGGGRLQGTTIDACNDHRIAMAASIGAVRATAPVIVDGSEHVSKSYPAFYNHLSLCGISCTEALS